MAQAKGKDISTTSMPKTLLYAMLALLALRLVSGIKDNMDGPKQAPQIAWTEYKDLQPGSSSAQKLRLYVFRAAWCEPCKRMESTVFTNKQIKDIIEANYTPITVTDRLKEDGKNPQAVTDLEKKYHVFAFPTLVIVGNDGEAIATLVGSASALSSFHFLSRAARPPT